MTCVSVPVKNAYVRNGQRWPDLRSIEISTLGKGVEIIGRLRSRDKIAGGGFAYLSLQEADQLCAAWLEARGKAVVDATLKHTLDGYMEFLAEERDRFDIDSDTRNEYEREFLVAWDEAHAEPASDVCEYCGGSDNQHDHGCPGKYIGKAVEDLVEP